MVGIWQAGAPNLEVSVSASIAADPGAPILKAGLGSPVQRIVEDLHATIAAEPLTGELATYIPELARADPALFGITIVTAEGEVHEAGDTRRPFTIQSISKPIVYAMGLEQHGAQHVRQRVGVEPTGEAFNSIRLQPGTGAPYNPMVNAGAIAVTALVGGGDPAGGLQRILAAFARYVGHPVGVDEAVYRSERATGHRNRGIAHLLKGAGVIDGDPEAALDLYFRQCSILVDAHDLALIAATLANKGVNPLTGERALAEEHVAPVLSVMATCGMYNAAGQWLHDIGLPAKSGVAGGILAALPGQLGIGTLSPPLDEHGNSIRGLRVCGELSRGFSLHLLDPPRPGLGALRRSRTGAGSRRRRPSAEVDALTRFGDRLRVHELQGDLTFVTTAALARAVLADAPDAGFVVLDLTRVTGANGAAVAILARLRTSLEDSGVRLLMVGSAGTGLAVLAAETLTAAGGGCPDRLDAAVEWCEDEILRLVAVLADDAGLMAFDVTELCTGMDQREAAEATAAVETLRFTPGDMLLHEGEPADALMVIGQGRVRVFANGDGGPITLTTLGAGMLVGEMGLVDGRSRSASVMAETPVVAYRLTRMRLDALSDDGALRTRTKVMLNLAQALSERLRRTSAQLAALE